MKPGPDPVCMCGPCHKRREAARRHYDRNRQSIIETNSAQKTRRKQIIRQSESEVSDEELDRIAIRMQIDEGLRAAKHGQIVDGDRVFDRLDRELVAMEKRDRR